MARRQECLRLVRFAAAVVGVYLGAATSEAEERAWIPTISETPKTLRARTHRINRPKELGTYYNAVVPGTLDLAERARLGLNYFTGVQLESTCC